MYSHSWWIPSYHWFMRTNDRALTQIFGAVLKKFLNLIYHLSALQALNSLCTETAAKLNRSLCSKRHGPPKDLAAGPDIHRQSRLDCQEIPNVTFHMLVSFVYPYGFLLFSSNHHHQRSKVFWNLNHPCLSKSLMEYVAVAGIGSITSGILHVISSISIWWKTVIQTGK